jgi:hypothetical protein
MDKILNISHRTSHGMCPVTGIRDQCQTMLHPPVSMIGIPAMKKLAREIAHWPEELREETAAKCLQQVREYLNSLLIWKATT